MKDDKAHTDSKIDQRLRSLAGDHNPFRTPENYFESLPSQIQTRIQSVPVHTKHSIFDWFFRPVVYFSAAAVLFLIVGMTYFFNLNPSANTISPIANSDIINQALISDYSEEMLVESLLNDVNSPGNAEGFVNLTSITDDDIIDYLILEKVNMELVYSE
ncbi:MAG: hypothetical protein Q7J34_12275 [Bacteroidales bacterium]|jgi:hypothetical protein|nr:hypothetical protein [Bacteroidales bacterium]